MKIKIMVFFHEKDIDTVTECWIVWIFVNNLIYTWRYLSPLDKEFQQN